MPSFRQQPLIYQLMGRVAPGAQLGYDEAYARIVRQLRHFSATSIVDAALRLLWTENPSKMDALQMAPWHILLIVKWALRDPHVALRVGPPIPGPVFDGIRQSVLDLLGVEHRRRPPTNIFLMMRAHLAQQVDFQRPEGWGFLRWPALIARQPENQPSHRQFLDVLGMTPVHFMDLSFGLFAAVLMRELPLEAHWFDSMRPTYGPSIDTMWQLVARDLAGLREELRRDQARRLPAKQELYEFPYLKRFPLVRMRDGRLHCWHPMVYARGLEDLVHLRLTDLLDEYTGPFSRLFEQYVIELAKAMEPAAVDEHAYREAVGGRPATVEALLPCGDVNVFVEAKMGLFRDDMLLTDSEVQAHQKAKRLREGIKQGWTVAADIRHPSSPFQAAATAERDFLILVTSRELFGDGTMLQTPFRWANSTTPTSQPRQDSRCATSLLYPLRRLSVYPALSRPARYLYQIY